MFKVLAPLAKKSVLYEKNKQTKINLNKTIFPKKKIARAQI